LKALLARRGNSRDRSPSSNTLKALLARKKQFERPKPCLEYLEGAAGPKRAIQDNFDRKVLSKEQTTLIRRTSLETFSKRQNRRKTLHMFG
jgi:hypothetical protein